MKYVVNDVVLTISNRQDAVTNRFCPFRSSGESHCGNWCPHFKFYEGTKGHDRPSVRISCGGVERDFTVTVEEEDV